MRRTRTEVERWVREGVAEVTWQTESTVEVRWTRTNRRQMVWVTE